MHLVFNSDTCSGCKACELVCTLQNFKEINPAKARLHVHGEFPAPGKYVMDLCDQCGACAEACPLDAIVLKGSTYRIKPDLCDHCMACVPACPNNVMKVDDEGLPYKCINCRQCVEICPRDALSMVKEPA